MPALVSVLLPYRNAAATLEEAVDSVLSQTGVDFELLAVDDGSTDDGPARIAGRPGVVHLSTGGCGLVGALQRGLAAARGSFIARMDGDDVCLPGRLARQIALLRSDDRLGVCGTRVAGFPAGAVGAGMQRYIAWQNQLVTPEDHRRELFIESPMCHPSVMLRRAALDEVGPWRDVGWPEDYDLWLRIEAAGWKLAKVPEILLRWRHGDGRMTFTDPSFARERFTETKAPHLARRVRELGRPLVMWGAGRSGKRLARALEAYGVRPQWFIDIDRNKIGNVARDLPIHAPDALARGEHTVVVAVGAIGARDEIREHLRAAAFTEGDDYLCTA